MCTDAAFCSQNRVQKFAASYTLELNPVFYQTLNVQNRFKLDVFVCYNIYLMVHCNKGN